MSRQKIRFNSGCKALLAITFSLLLASCGGGGGGGSDAAAPAPVDPATPSQPTTNTTTVSGAVTKGPVAGAQLEFYEVDNFGFGIGSPVATATTNADGTFSADIPDNVGVLLIVASGGAFVDESDQEPDPALRRRVQLTPDQFFLGILPQGATSVAINPFTDVLIERARFLGGIDGTFPMRFAEAKAIFDAQMGFDVLTTIPANPIDPAPGSNNAQMQYALILGGLANVINNVSIQLGLPGPTYDVIVAVTLDLIDGQIDGMQFDQPQEIFIGDERAVLPTDVDFNAEINRFRNNNFANFPETEPPVIVIEPGAGNTAPTADAGPDQSVAKASQVTLDGRASIDAESGITYSWSQTSGEPVVLDNALSATPTFTAPEFLIGTKTLSFTLTVADALGVTATDTVDVVVNGPVPATFFAIDQDEFGDGVGEDIDSGGRITFNPDGTGIILDDAGLVDFTYSVDGPTIRVEFEDGFIVDDYDEFIDTNEDGEATEQFLVEEVADFIEFTLLQDNPNGDEFTIRDVGTRVYTGINTTDVIAPEPYDISGPLKGYDYAQQIPFSFADGDQRNLLFNVNPEFGDNLFFDDELQDDIFTFNSDGTGTTARNGVSFTYSIEADGHLSVTFANGESADYYHLFTQESGDVIATEYTLTEAFFEEDGLFIGDVSLSYQRAANAVFPTDLASLAGIYSGRNYEETFGSRLISFRLNPDGTGSLEFELDTNQVPSFPGDRLFLAKSPSGICWSSPSSGVILVNRSQSMGVVTPNSPETSTSYCSNLSDTSIGDVNVVTLFSVSDTAVRGVNERQGSSCDDLPPGTCEVAEFTPRSFEPFSADRVPLTEVPPIAENDYRPIPVGTPITIDVLTNDVTRGLPIDPTTVEIVLDPLQGTAVVETSGEITYDPGTFTGREFFQYRVNDTDGNPSTIGFIIIDIGAPQAIAADQGALRGDVVVLDGSASTDNGAIVGYEWTQTGGTPVTLDDPFSPTPSFSAPNGLPMTDTDTLTFQLKVTDDSGIDGFTSVNVNVQPAISMETFAVPSYDPTLEAGRDIGPGALLKLFPGGTGEYANWDGPVPINWTATNTELTVDFSPIGGLQIDQQTVFIDLDMDEDPEEVLVTTTADQFIYTLLSDGALSDEFIRETVGTVTQLDVAAGLIFSTEPFGGFVDHTFVGIPNVMPFNITNGEFRTFPSNVATDRPTIPGGPNTPPQTDHIGFFSAGSGMAIYKDTSITYSTGADNSLEIDFLDGEHSTNYLLISTPDENVVGTIYYYPDTSFRVITDVSFTDNGGVNFNIGNVPGIYEVNDGFPLNNGTRVASNVSIRLHPDGRGQVEREYYDPDTGLLQAIVPDPEGICWQTDGGNDLLIAYTFEAGAEYPGSVIPSVSTCSSINTTVPDNTLIESRTTNHLFDVGFDSKLRTTVIRDENQCIADDPGCDPSILETKRLSHRIFENNVSFVTDPPLAAIDSYSASPGFGTQLDILTNDIDNGIDPLDPATVFIEVGPYHGDAIIDPVSGVITYTSDPGFDGQDMIYYRVLDTAGNLSTIGIVVIDVMGAQP